jgi:SAM-dependent methyltransferase
MNRLSSLQRFATSRLKESGRNILKLIINGLDSRSKGLLIKQLIRELDQEDRAYLARILKPEMSLAMGIPMPLASPLTVHVYQASIEDLLQAECKEHLAVPESRSLDLGCGLEPRNPFQAEHTHGVDIRGKDETHIVASDLFNQPIPYGDDFFSYVTAFDFIEHVPRTVCEQDRTRFPFVELMDEIWRVLKPGGIFLSYTPAFPSQQVFQDPTHVNTISEHTFPLYFCHHEGREPLARMYGFNSTFRLISQQWSHFYLVTLMEKV